MKRSGLDIPVSSGFDKVIEDDNVLDLGFMLRQRYGIVAEWYYSFCHQL